MPWPFQKHKEVVTAPNHGKSCMRPKPELLSYFFHPFQSEQQRIFHGQFYLAWAENRSVSIQKQESNCTFTNSVHQSSLHRHIRQKLMTNLISTYLHTPQSDSTYMSMFVTCTGRPVFLLHHRVVQFVRLLQGTSYRPIFRSADFYLPVCFASPSASLSCFTKENIEGGEIKTLATQPLPLIRYPWLQ